MGRFVRLLTAAVLVTASVAVVRPSASAVTSAVTCDGLQAAFDAAQDGETIELDGSCFGSYELPTGISISLTGDPDNGVSDGFEGSDEGSPMLVGEDPKDTTISSLHFRDSFTGAIKLSGKVSVGIHDNEFTTNARSDGPLTFPGGGAVSIVAGDGCGSSEDSDPVRISDNIFIGNTAYGRFDVDTGQFTGEGGALYIRSAGHPIAIVNNMFSDNRAFRGGGGALSLSNHGSGCAPNVDIQQNTFESNEAHGGAAMHLDFERSLDTFVAENDFIENLGVNTGAVSVFSDSEDGSGCNGSSSLVFESNDFTGNRAASGAGLGGGLAVRTSRNVTLYNNHFEANRAKDGGGLYLEAIGEETCSMGTHQNTFFGNSASRGGGAQLVVDVAQISGNVFEDNEASGENPGGGGLAVFGAGLSSSGEAPFTQVRQQDNRFVSNEADLSTSNFDFVGGGGGEVVQGVNVESTGDRFVGNVVTDGSGGGILVRSGDSESGAGTTFRGENLVAAANSGGGVFTRNNGCVVADCPGSVELSDATVVNNNAGGIGAGFGTHQLTLVNSIVTSDDRGLNEVAGFDSVAASFSDVCADRVPYSGPGNICADPILVDPANGDVHQTPWSPTIDAGESALVSALLPQDYEFDLRILGDSVDMGADEFTGTKLPRPAHVVLSPDTATTAVGESHCVTATVTDAANDAIAGVSVLFFLDSGPTQGAGQTNESGQAQFCYTSDELGTDLIGAFADTNGDGEFQTFEPFAERATVTWVISSLCEVSGGGNLIAANGDKATFSADVRAQNGGGAGDVNFTDHGPAKRLKLRSKTIDGVTCQGSAATITGTVSDNGSDPVSFTIDLQDLGAKGRDDTYRIRLSTGYDTGVQRLHGGQIEVRS
jgi:hypothetical protein